MRLIRQSEPKIPNIPFTYGYGNYYSRFGLTSREGRASKLELLKAYTSWVFTCVTIRAEAQAKTRWRCYTENAAYERVFLKPDHPAQFMLDNPCPFTTKWLFNFFVSMYLDLVGEFFAYIARDSLKIPRQLWPLPPDKMITIPGKTAEQMIAGYKLDWNTGASYEFTADEILHLRQPNPRSFIEGFSATEAAAYIIDINMAQKRWHKNFYDKDATPDGLILAEQDYDPAPKKEFVDDWLKYFEGPNKKRRIGFLDQGMKYQQIALKPRELEYTKTHEQVRNEIFGMFRVPLSKAGLDEQIRARSTAETMNYQFYSDVIEPRTNMIEDQLKLDLMDIWFKQSVPIKVGHESLVPQDDERQAAIDKLMVDGGIKTRNEVRKRDGDPPLAGGDEVLVNANFVPLASVGAGPKPAKEIGEIKRTLKDLVAVVSDLLHKSGETKPAINLDVRPVVKETIIKESVVEEFEITRDDLGKMTGGSIKRKPSNGDSAR